MMRWKKFSYLNYICWQAKKEEDAKKKIELQKEFKKNNANPNNDKEY